MEEFETMPMTDDDRATRPVAPADPLRKDGDDTGPSKPDVQRPDRSDLLKRMKRVDPDQARRYRQRSGE
jgi:hypothetical protein